MSNEDTLVFVRDGLVEGFRKGRGSYELINGYRLQDPATGKLLDQPMSCDSCQRVAIRENKKAIFKEKA